MSRPVLALVGPTASGKTELAISLAEHLPVEIVSMDSALVYQDMNIGTAKPDVKILQQVPHHLVDLITPEERYSAARYRQDALDTIRLIQSKGHIPLLVGGTMLYFKVLLEGLDDLPSGDDNLRKQIEAEAAELGWPSMHSRLGLVDPMAASRIEPADAQRIQRALEVYLVTGRPMSSFWNEQRSASRELTFSTLALIPVERARLHRRIELRFDGMLQAGLVDELAQLKMKYRLEPSMPSMRCVGYRQVWKYLAGEYARDEMRERGIYATRQLAKRQLTWLRAMQLKWVDCFDEALAREVDAWATQAIDP
jgi:tRNA dimethylallyltransferase